METNPPSDLVDVPISKSGPPADLQDVGKREKPFGEKALEFVEPTAEALGTIGGGALGSFLGPAGTVGGAGLGYGMTKEIIHGIKRLGDYEKPRTATETITEPIKNVLTGATYETGGLALPGILKGIGETGTSLANKIKRPINYYKLSKGTEAGKLSKELSESLPSVTEKAKEVIGKGETSATLAERLKRARQETNLKTAEKTFLGKAQSEAEKSAAKLADLGQAKDPAVLGDEMQRRITGTEHVLSNRLSQQAARDYESYFEQAKGFETSVPRQIMLERLKTMSVDPSVGSAGRKYATQAYKDLEESTDALGAEKEFRKYFEQASAPQQAGYGAIEQHANKVVSDIISDALDTHASARIKARKNYAQFNTPLDAFETLFGKKGVATETSVPERVKMMPSQYPDTYFKNRDTVRALREQLSGDEAAVRKFGNQHAVNELSGKDATQAQKWLENNKSWVDEIPGLNDRVKRYVYELAKSEETAAGLTEKAKKLSGKQREVITKRESAEKEIAETAAKHKQVLNDSLRDLELVSPDKVPVVAQNILNYLKDKKLMSMEDLQKLQTQINTVTQTYKNTEEAKRAVDQVFRRAIIGSLGYGGLAGGAYWLYQSEK